MNYSLRISEIADRDADEISFFIARDNMDAAVRFCDAVVDTYERIREGPLRSARHELAGSIPELRYIDDLRACPVQGFPNFLVLFNVVGDVIHVSRIVHGARDIPAVISEGKR